ncbi:MAG: TonB-dependent receptor plug domain-containing protein [Alistipes communis]
MTLRENKQILEEVVVVGYGSVKRRDLIGAVDQVDSRQFAERPNPSVSRSLQGAIPNLNISMRDGKPSRAATIDIRGTGSIGSGGGALVLIDGVEGDLETVNPQDIASVSVLKDHVGRHYGARGARRDSRDYQVGTEGEVNVTYSADPLAHRCPTS